MTDFKEGKRVKASREQWKKLQAEKQGPCRVCGASAYTGYTSLHHLVPRSQGGDDVADNLVPLCGSGTTGCHGKVEARDPYASKMLRVNLTEAEELYVSVKKGWDWLWQRYPLPRDGEVLSADEFGPKIVRKSVTEADGLIFEDETVERSWPPHTISGGVIPGHDCPTCNRRIPHPKKATTPTNRPFSFRIPEEERDSFREVLEAASRHIGNHDKPFWQWNTVNAGLVLLLQGQKDLLR